MKIIELKCKNHGVIVALELDLAGKNVVVKGATGTGKTTVISILWDLITKKPRITHGAYSETLEATLEDGKGGALHCKRINTAKTSTLTVCDEEGEMMPAVVAKKLLSSISKNPLELFEKTGNERFEHLLKCSSVSIDEHKKLKLERKTVAADRLTQKRVIEVLKGKIGERPVGAERVDTAIKQGELQGAYAQNQRIENIKKDIGLDITNIKTRRDIIAKLTKEIAIVGSEIDAFTNNLAAYEEVLQDLAIVDITKIEAELAESGARNKAADDLDAWIAKKGEMLNEEIKCEELNKDIKSLDKKIECMLDCVKLPLDGLTIDGSDILYNGVDFDSLGTSDQILISSVMTAMQIVNAKNSIHAMRIDRGESMDDATQAKVIKKCNDIGVQLFISIVDRSAKNQKYEIEIV